MVISPSSAHAFRVSVVGHAFVVIGELFLAQRTFPVLLHDLAIEQFAHFRWRPQFAVSPRMMRVVYAANSRVESVLAWHLFPATAKQ